jgi:hypothetical protein
MGAHSFLGQRPFAWWEAGKIFLLVKNPILAVSLVVARRSRKVSRCEELIIDDGPVEGKSEAV